MTAPAERCLRGCAAMRLHARLPRPPVAALPVRRHFMRCRHAARCVRMALLSRQVRRAAAVAIRAKICSEAARFARMPPGGAVYGACLPLSFTRALQPDAFDDTRAPGKMEIEEALSPAMSCAAGSSSRGSSNGWRRARRRRAFAPAAAMSEGSILRLSSISMHTGSATQRVVRRYV